MGSVVAIGQSKMNLVREYDSEEEEEEVKVEEADIHGKEGFSFDIKRERKVQHIVGNWPSLIFLNGYVD
jgi:hypothetical protein